MRLFLIGIVTLSLLGGCPAGSPGSSGFFGDLGGSAGGSSGGNGGSGGGSNSPGNSGGGGSDGYTPGGGYGAGAGGGTAGSGGNGGGGGTGTGGGTDTGGSAGNPTIDVPLMDMQPNDVYKGYAGQLYDGSNEPPAAHLQAALDRSAAVQPLNVAGAVDAANGRIVLATFGFSNPRRESETFVTEVAGTAGLNPKLSVVNCCRAGEGTVEMSDPATTYWDYVTQELASVGNSPAQVQFAWLKEVKAYPDGEEFVSYASSMRDQLKVIMQRLHQEFPNLKIVYVTSRSYGGYSTDLGSPEPWAFETGFAMKWLIQDQIDGDAALNFDPGRGTVVSPLILWGPYIWANGEQPRSDGLIWTQADFTSDGRHPSSLGKIKVSGMLIDFFSNSATTRSWFVANQ